MESSLNNLHPLERFSDRVQNYVKYRPSYPGVIVDFFESQLGLQKTMMIADVGSGTGLFSELLLKEDYKVFCVEPNAEMRHYAELTLSRYPGFSSIDGRAEETRLPDHAIDFITVIQSFHWMNPTETKVEFRRILKSNGKIIIAWILAKQNTPFLHEYEEIRKTFGIDYKAVERANENILIDFYDPHAIGKKIFHHSRSLDFENLKGQLISASFIPLPGHPKYENMITELTRIYKKYQYNGFVTMEYEIPVFWNI